ncbi:UPF0061-domain-containing protein [Hesseltinella vesiculosa]|uniref:Selenoprotein O n=1 Tax=Hesseltinella vesiculosa TaxID=101127 RepID=A0A1X2GGK3_9FUNG|nr:UPF0061-domain-containing protein [Hesseltinella vesiculosa]
MGIRVAAKRTLDSLPLRPGRLTQYLSCDTTNADSEQFSRISRPVHEDYVHVNPEVAPEPELLSVSNDAVIDLELDPDETQTDQFVQVFSGNTLLHDTRPWSLCYGGHQFSLWANQLGDGRAISLFETKTKQGECWDIQLKGAGRTPFSRFGDGYAVLRSSIREYLCSEHMHALGVPTTRALALITTSREVYREPEAETDAVGPEHGAVVARMAPSWLRFGSFELPYARNNMKAVQRLADYCADQVYGPEALECLDASAAPANENKYTRLFLQVAKRTAIMVARWQAVGFNHGVMNTDNFSILGLTLDYGPFQFMDFYEPAYICNHSDTAGQYAFKRQPTVCVYNLFKFGVPLFELIGAGNKVDEIVYVDPREADEATKATATDDVTRQAYREAGKEYVTKVLSEDFTDWFMEELQQVMQNKLGLLKSDASTMADVIIPLLDWATEFKVDHHRLFRSMSKYEVTSKGEDHDNALALSTLDIIPKDPARLDDAKQALAPWLSIYRHLLLDQDAAQENKARQLRMNANNPRFVLRNWIVQQVIDAFDKQPQDEAKKTLNACLYACTHPYQEHYNDPQIEAWINASVPEWGQDLKCSCSS